MNVDIKKITQQLDKLTDGGDWTTNRLNMICGPVAVIGHMETRSDANTIAKLPKIIRWLIRRNRELEGIVELRRREKVKRIQNDNS